MEEVLQNNIIHYLKNDNYIFLWNIEKGKILESKKNK